MIKTKILAPVLEDSNKTHIFKNLQIEFIKGKERKGIEFIKFIKGNNEDFRSNIYLDLN